MNGHDMFSGHFKNALLEELHLYVAEMHLQAEALYLLTIVFACQCEGQKMSM